MIRSVLIANRGEIACRIIQTAKAMNIHTIAIATEADRSWLHWQQADDAAFIGDGPAAESYLNGPEIIRIALNKGADAIHPGYGFLSENAEFARACADAGLVFIGPPADAISAMGSKSQAKALMEKAGVPVVPGYHGNRQQPQFLKQKAYEIGYPVLIKAVSGGGGRGMRLVNKAIEFDEQLVSAKREALAAFGDDRVLIERYLDNPRHIEMQVFADGHGNAVHLFERDCSVQRRHQKVIEEAPAPGLSETVRAAMGEAAVKATKSVGYQGAGTVEFIVDGANLAQPDSFFFMEMNTRLQVEHPVTEMVTGHDLVEWQLRIAGGEALPLEQDGLSFSGHAMEVRIYAEDPAADFQPAMGKLWRARFPVDKNIRIDSGVMDNTVVSPFYDSMLAKIIVHEPDRDGAINRMREALDKVEIAGVKTNIAFLAAILADAEFCSGGIETGYVDRRISQLTRSQPNRETAALALDEWLGLGDKAEPHLPGPWQNNAGFEVGGLGRTVGFDILVDGQPTDAEVRWTNGAAKSFVDAETPSSGIGDATIVWGGQTAYVLTDGQQLAVGFPSPLDRIPDASASSGRVPVPMHGRVVSVRFNSGDQVRAGDTLFTLEAMKMEHSINAPVDGIISQLLVSEGDQVDEGAVALLIEQDAAADPD